MRPWRVEPSQADSDIENSLQRLAFAVDLRVADVPDPFTFPIDDPLLLPMCDVGDYVIGPLGPFGDREGDESARGLAVLNGGGTIGLGKAVQPTVQPTRHCPAQPTRQVCLGKVAGPSANRDTTGAKVARRSAKRVGGLFLSTRG